MENYKNILLSQIKSYNEQEGSLNELDCSICKNKGYNQELRYEPLYDEEIIVMVECECMKQRKALRKAKNSGLGDYLKKRIDDYNTSESWQKTNKEKALKYIKNRDNEWFVMLGQSGSGKTLLCSIIANYQLLVEKKELMYITWTDFISKLKREMMSDKADNVSNYLEQAKNVEILFIDELLKKYNDTDLKYIIEIINYRYTKNLATIITSEKTIGELIAIDEATFSRVVEKAGEFIINIQKDIKKNYRIKEII